MAAALRAREALIVVPAPTHRDGARIVIERKPPARPANAVRDLLRRVARAGRAELVRQRTAIDSRDLASILAAVGATDPRAGTWSPLERHGGDPAIVVVGPDGGAPSAFIRVARSEAARDGLARAARALDALRDGLADVPMVARLIPTVLGHGEVSAGSWMAEAACLVDPADRSAGTGPPRDGFWPRPRTRSARFTRRPHMR